MRIMVISRGTERSSGVWDGSIRILLYVRSLQYLSITYMAQLPSIKKLFVGHIRGNKRLRCQSNLMNYFQLLSSKHFILITPRPLVIYQGYTGYISTLYLAVLNTLLLLLRYILYQNSLYFRCLNNASFVYIQKTRDSMKKI